jgi:hypothetical protein
LRIMNLRLTFLDRIEVLCAVHLNRSLASVANVSPEAASGAPGRPRGRSFQLFGA